MQDAYTCVATYLRRTPQNTGIIADRVNSLVATGLPDLPSAHSLETLARVQALLIHQVIRFSSPNVALRALATQNISVLESWLTILMRHTRFTLLNPSSTPLWHTWILAEIWLITAGIQGLYKFFTCPDCSNCVSAGRYLRVGAGSGKR
jgi:hypothetical protein